MNQLKCKYSTLAILLLLQAFVKAKAFAFMIRRKSSSSQSSLFSSSTSSTTTTGTTSTEELSLTARTVAPSWEELSAHLDQLQKVGDDDDDESESESVPPPPLVTLLRDTNGWCPFCERVWFALQIKNIPYEENLISLYDKPKWFLDMVPTGLVPAVLIHTDTIKKQADDFDEEEKTQPQRTLIWESLDILKALDEYFPDTPKLVFEDDEDYIRGRETMEKLSSAGFKYTYNMRNETLTTEEKEMQKVEFEKCLDDLDEFIGEKSESPFFLNGITGLDVEAIPTLERWRYQLPLTKNIDITDGRPNLTKWFKAMDEYQPYIQRVGGDKYSWTAVASTFLKIFGSGKDGDMSKETMEIIANADAAAEKLRSDFLVDPQDGEMYSKELLDSGRIEAAAKLIGNYEAIINDCTNKDPKSQQDLGRAEDPKNADWVVRLVAAKLLNVECPQTADDAGVDMTDAAMAARTIASRLCVPRDVGGPAASVLRYELAKTASEL